MSKHRLLRFILIVIGCIAGLPVILAVGLLVALTIPSVQQKVAQKAADILSDKIGIEASVGHFSVKAPFDILLEDVFAADGQGDTLAYVGCLDVRLRMDALPDSIAVRHLEIDNIVAHTDSLIPLLRIDGCVGRLSAGVEPFGFDRLTLPITNAILEDADITLGFEDGNDEDHTDSTTLALAIDFQNASLNNVKFCMEPINLRLDVDKAETSVLIDLGNSCYTVRNIDASHVDFGIEDFSVYVEELDGDAIVDLEKYLITSDRLHAAVPEYYAEAVVRNTSFDLNKLHVKTVGNGRFKDATFSLKADYDINDEAFNADINLDRTDIAEILKLQGNELIVAGNISATGKGINPSDKDMSAHVLVGLDSCRFNGIDISGINLEANLNKGTVHGMLSSPVHCCDSSYAASLLLDGRFAVGDFLDEYPRMEFDARLREINACIPGDTLQAECADIDFKTRKGKCNAVVNMPGISLTAAIPAHVMEIPSLFTSFPNGINSLDRLDSLLASVPDINADLQVLQDNPFRGMLQKRGLDLNEIFMSLQSAGSGRNLNLKLETPELNGEYRLPAVNAELNARLSGSRMDATFNLDAKVSDGVMSVTGIDAGVDLGVVLLRNSDDIRLDGNLELTHIVYDDKNIGNRNISFNVRPDSNEPGRFTANAVMDDIPIELVKQFVTLPEDLDIQGKLATQATVCGLPDTLSISAGVRPVDVTALYAPYNVQLRLGEQEITLKDNYVNLNGLSIIGVDNTYIELDGGLNLNTMLLDVSVRSGRFEPVELPENGPVPVYGKLLIGLDGSISGPADSMLVGIDVSILPETDITYPIDKKNLAQVNPSGIVRVGFNTESGLTLGGRLDISNGKLFYSPKLYPIMPFSIDRNSYIRFNGVIDDTELAISASQGAKATYKPGGQSSRMVDFITGVTVSGSLDDISIGFYLDAPNDKEIQKELAETPEEDREGLAAILLATGMYASDSNEAAQMGGYALSSIIQSRLNAATSNKLGGKVNLDFGVAKTKHGKEGVETTDYTLNVSKNFFNDRLNINLGGSVSGNADVNKNSTSFLNNMSAECKLDSAGTLKARLFSMKDFNNIVEGELVKSGIGIVFDKTLDSRRDSLDRSLDMEVEGNVVYRSNNQIGPDAAVSLSKRNLFGRNDVFTAKIKGAYYWDLNPMQNKDVSRNDTYLLGADFSLNFPYLQLGERVHKYSGQTLYRLGYLNQNISGNYGLHKLYGGVDYAVHRGKYITHSFSPLYLSVVLADRASETLASSLSLTDLYKLFAGNEFIPSAKYSFSYNNYRDKDRNVNTALDIQLKESANLISGVMAACGSDFNEKNKLLLGINYDQFVKCQFEIRNRFRLHSKLELATRATAGSVVSFGNSVGSPLSESFSIGGPNSIRAFSPGSIGPGDFHNDNYSSQIFHKGDFKLEVNAELRFPIVWKLNGAVFVDAGNVWNMRNPREYMSSSEIDAFMQAFNLTEMYNDNLNADTFLNQIALGTGAGLRLDYESIVIRLDLGVAIHAPFDTGRAGYYNIPNFWKDGLRLNFGIGYPF